MSNDVKHTEKYGQEWPINICKLYQTGEIEIEQRKHFQVSMEMDQFSQFYWELSTSIDDIHKKN